MKHPSIRKRLILGSCLLTALVLAIANFSVYQAIARSLRHELDLQLFQSASILSKYSELEGGKVVYEWHEAMESGDGPGISGVFQFWDINSNTTLRSPDLKSENLPKFHGALNQPVIRDIKFADGRAGRAVGLMHLPFLDEEGKAEMARLGIDRKVEELPQILVTARETSSLEKQLFSIRKHLLLATLATVTTLWLAIIFISKRTLAPIGHLSSALLKRTTQEKNPPLEIPVDLPSELVPLAEAFNTTLTKIEAAREHERDFALHAAHELRTPIAGIHSTLEAALHRPRETLDLRKRMEAAMEITSSMRVVINSLMRMARLRGGLERISKQKFPPEDLISRIIAMEQETDQSSHLAEIIRESDELVPIFTDLGLFNILATNLIENAFRHSPKGGKITVKLLSTQERFALSISNDRGSLSAENSNRLFEPFQRGPQANADSPGAGIGLSLAREIATMLGGSLKVLFEDPNAVTFRFELPA